MNTQAKIRELEYEVTALWRVVEDERLWHPSVIQEIKRRSQDAHRSQAREGLRKAGEVYATLRQCK